MPYRHLCFSPIWELRWVSHKFCYFDASLEIALRGKHMSSFPEWLRSEKDVEDFFTLFGFMTERISINGRQIDIIAKRYDVFSLVEEIWIIEVTTEKVDEEKGSSDYQKLDLARRNYKNAKCMLISTKGFTDSQKETLIKLDVVPKTYSEFEESQVNLRRYALNALKSIERVDQPDIGYNKRQYIQPQLEKDDKSIVDGDEWIYEFLGRDTPSVCALLGDLGSGKTSILKRALQLGCQRYLDDPQNNSIPIYIPLGKYKQHSGNLDQMLMSEFKKSGQETFPSAIVDYLINKKRIRLLLDGLDEVHPIQNDDDVLGTVITLLSSIGNNSVSVISSRRQFFRSTAEESALFGNYNKIKLESINTGISKALNGKNNTYIITLKQFSDVQINKYLKNRCAMSDNEINEFFNKFYGFKDMAKTPVLLSMMATTIDEQLIDPVSKEMLFPLLTLYEQYTNRWIIRDVSRARLQSNQRRRLSEVLADKLLWNGQESEVWEKLLLILKEQHDWKDNPISPDEFDLDVRKSGFLIRDIDDRFRFIHRSIMEFFAAKMEFERLENGERPRYFPTDGYQNFLLLFIAKSWLENNTPPLPKTSWEVSRGMETINNQASILASASHYIPGGKKGNLSLFNFFSNGDIEWNNVNIDNSKITHTLGKIRFIKCNLTSTSLKIINVDSLILENCHINNVLLSIDCIPTWNDPTIKLDGPYGVLDIPKPYWMLAKIVSNGGKVLINNLNWTISENKLKNIADISHLMKTAVPLTVFNKSRYLNLKTIFEKLVKNDIIIEDVSHNKNRDRNFITTKKFINLVGELKTNPLDCQEKLDCFD